jgi:hypothetical protein
VSKQTEVPVTVIVVPPVLATLLGELAERMSRSMGEPVEATRRLVELSVLSRGSQIVQEEITAMEDQARRMGWPTT